MSSSSLPPSSSLLDQFMNATNNNSSSAAAPAPSSGPRPAPTLSSSGFCQVDFSENEQFIRLSLEVPGVALKDLQVEFQHGVLVVRGSRTTQYANVRHQHKFCRRFAMDTDVVNISRIQANLNNKTGILTIMAPKMRKPSTLQIAITEEDDEVFQASLTKSFQQQQQLAAADADAAAEAKQQAAVTRSIKVVKAEVKVEGTKEEENTRTTTPAAVASLPNVVSMGCASDALEEAKSVPGKRNHKSSLQSHLMIRRSMSQNKLKTNSRDKKTSRRAAAAKAR